MQRRQFLKATAATACTLSWARSAVHAGPAEPHHESACGLTYASPQEAMKAPRETLAYVTAIYTGTGIARPDYLATVDVDPASRHYGQVVARLPMPHRGDELHHYGWNACSSCHGQPGYHRRYLIVPGLHSGRIHIVDVEDPRHPKLHKVIEGSEIARRTNLSAPHTVHCLPDGQIMISMLGSGNRKTPGGFLLLNQDFEIADRWKKRPGEIDFNYDFWYQPRHNVMISSEWAAPETVAQGFSPDDVAAGKYGRKLHFWDWKQRTVAQSVDLGEQGMIPLEVRFHHDPDSSHGFVGAALSSNIWHWYRDDEQWRTEKVVQVDPIPDEDWPFPVPGLITDLLLSLDDRWLYFSNWLHGDLRQYDVSDPSNPKMTGRLWLGGVIGRDRKPGNKALGGGPQMLQLSLDGKRLYVTNSLYSVWDNQFYPAMKTEGSYLLQIDCDTEQGGLTLNEDFHVDFGKEPGGPCRAHEIRFPNGDSTSDIWI